MKGRNKPVLLTHAEQTNHALSQPLPFGYTDGNLPSGYIDSNLPLPPAAAPVSNFDQTIPQIPGGSYQTLSTLHTHPDIDEDKVLHLDETDRAQCEVEVREGLLHWKYDGRRVDTTGLKTDPKPEPNARGHYRAIYAMSEDGRIYVSTIQKFGVIHHSTLLQVKDGIAAAGELEADNGVLKMFNKGSGHFRPSRQHLAQFAHHLKKLGVDENHIATAFKDEF